MSTGTLLAGIFFSGSVLHSRFYYILLAVVLLNTTIFAAIAITKILPKRFKFAWFRRGRVRSKTRSIYPDAKP